jgi:hypothetical protein
MVDGLLHLRLGDGLGTDGLDGVFKSNGRFH